MDLQDRLRQRRIYVVKRWFAVACARLSELMCDMAGMCTILTACSCFFFLIVSLLNAVRWIHNDRFITATLFCASVTAWEAAILAVLFRIHKAAEQLEWSIDYVPPVDTENLPYEEVLVRAANRDTVERATLVRPTSGGRDASTDCLLRAQATPDTETKHAIL